MRHVKIDQVLKSYCAEVNDNGLGRYPNAYIFAYAWMEQVKDPRVRAIPKDVELTVDGRWARYPEQLAIAEIGISVNGCFTPMLKNDYMLDPRCGPFMGEDTGAELGNPDYPAINIGHSNARIQSGHFWPGAGSGRSERGYYRQFPEDRLILLDETSRYATIIARGQLPTFCPGTMTWVPVVAMEPIKTWIAHRFDFENEKLRLDYVRAMNNFRSAMNAEPLSTMISVVQSRRGQIGV